MTEADGAATDDEGRGDAAVDGDELGSLMMQQLNHLLDSWTTVLETVAQQGVDPRPMLEMLAGTLRATADQLDPPGATRT
jgi:hypothetical protein